jgi:hypothetical protein
MSTITSVTHTEEQFEAARLFVEEIRGCGPLDPHELARFLAQREARPIPMRLECPGCGELHIDEGEPATTPHRTHACQFCGVLWAPAVVATVGVRFLPGCKNSEDVAAEAKAL